jgi:hypothetical protein
MMPPGAHMIEAEVIGIIFADDILRAVPKVAGSDLRDEDAQQAGPDIAGARPENPGRMARCPPPWARSLPRQL